MWFRRRQHLYVLSKLPAGESHVAKTRQCLLNIAKRASLASQSLAFTQQEAVVV